MHGKLVGKIMACVFVAAILTSPVSALIEQADEKESGDTVTKDWYIETVDSNGGGAISIALDSNNYPYISYFCDDGVKISWLANHAWKTETIDQCEGLSSSLAIDRSNTPHMTYVDHEGGNLKYSIKAGERWKTEIVDSSGWVVYASMVIDAHNHPHIAYIDYQYGDAPENGAVKYATKNDESWDIEIVDEGGNAGFFTTITINSQGQTRIFYDDWKDDSLTMAQRTGAQWELETIASTGSPTDSAFNPEDNPQLCYVDYSNNYIKYAYKTDGGWNSDIVDRLEDISFPSLSFDNDHVPHLSYVADNSVLKYASKTEDNWDIQMVDEGSIGSFSSLAIDSNGNTHIAYFEEENVELKYATTWEHETNHAPQIPEKPSGPTEGTVDESYTYSSSTTDLDDDEIKYGWDWDGDKIIDEWTDYYSSGRSVETTHTWIEKGGYNIRVKAQDEHGAITGWSDPLSVSMPKTSVFPLLQHLEKLLRLIYCENKALAFWSEKVTSRSKLLSIFNDDIKYAQQTTQSIMNLEKNNKKHSSSSCGRGQLFLNKWRGGYSAGGCSSNFYLYCHIPVFLENEQAPLFYGDAWCDSPGTIRNFKAAHGYSGTNTLLDIEMQASQEVNVFWTSWTLVKGNDYEDLPDRLEITPEEELPLDVKKWLSATDFLQIEEGRIRMVAKILKGHSNNVNAIAERVTIFTGKTLPYQGGTDQSALSSLVNHYAVCTGKADLASSLLRVNGIPARVLFVCPTHYITEYYAHPYGWVRSETTAGYTPCPNEEYTVTFCAHPEDETSSNSVHGQSPYSGVIAYWGTSNYKCRWGIKYGNWNCLGSYQLTADAQNVEEALDITREVWNYYHTYVGTGLSGEDQGYFDNGVNYEQTAIECFQRNDIEGYIENMENAGEEFKKIG